MKLQSFRFLDFQATSYSLAYSFAEACHEKSLAMPFNLDAPPNRRFVRDKWTSAWRIASEQRRTIIRLKLESRAAACCRIERIDGVVQPAGGPNHGNGTVLQTVNLIQAARLVARGHQENIRAGLDLVREDVVIGHFHAEFLRDTSWPGRAAIFRTSVRLRRER